MTTSAPPGLASRRAHDAVVDATLPDPTDDASARR
jgi:hypothetical protein